MQSNEEKLKAVLNDCSACLARVASILEVTSKIADQIYAGNPPSKQADEQKAEMFCIMCGNKITNYDGRHRRKFCCAKCKQDWWNEHRNSNSRESNAMRTCQFCGKEFYVSKASDQKYCCTECFHNSRRKNNGI